MPEDSRFRVFAITGFDFSNANDATVSGITTLLLRASAEANWWDDPATGMRFSIAKCDRWEGKILSGVLTQQHELERHLYTDAKLETHAVTDSYEDRFFVVDFEKGQLALEWRRFYGKPPLTQPRTIVRLGQIMSEILVEFAPSGEVTLVPFEGTTSKEEFLSLFYANRVLDVDVERVASEAIPLSVVLVNPNPHLEGALRDILVHDHALNAIDRLTASHDENEPGDLSRAAIVRAAVHSGQPKQIRYETPSGNIRVRNQTERGIITVNITTEATDSVEDRIAITDAVVNAVRGVDLPVLRTLPGRTSTDNLELFDE